MSQNNSQQHSQSIQKVGAQSTSPVAFGGYRCDCTLLAAQMDEIPECCPTHNVGLLGPRSWEQNPNNVPLGLTDGAITRKLVKELQS